MTEFHLFLASAAAAMAVSFAAGWQANNLHRRRRARRKARATLAAVELEWHGYGHPPIKPKPRRWCRGINLRGRDFRP